MSDEAAFLKALRENPGDDTTRLVYADWLDERNDPRAEFIRLRQQQAQLIARINELSAQFDPAWLAAVGGPRLKPEDIRQRSGRMLWLQELRQHNVYAGLLEGAPTREGNRRTIERLVAAERSGGEPYLIQPDEKSIDTGESLASFYSRMGGAAALPTIACVGRFQSSHAKDEARHASELTVIWFQEEFAFPIDPAIREQIRAIDWEKHATDFDY
jgi:uncharacterized protein (TIGR02996 family)